MDTRVLRHSPGNVVRNGFISPGCTQAITLEYAGSEYPVLRQVIHEVAQRLFIVSAHHVGVPTHGGGGSFLCEDLDHAVCCLGPVERCSCSTLDDFDAVNFAGDE